MWKLVCRNFFKKVPCTLKNSLRPHIPCASGNRLLQSFWQQIQDLRFKINAIEILFDKVLENQNLNNITYNFISKMQWNCILPKVLLDFFQKIVGYWGNAPRSYINLYLAKKPNDCVIRLFYKVYVRNLIF